MQTATAMSRHMMKGVPNVQPKVAVNGGKPEIKASMWDEGIKMGLLGTSQISDAQARSRKGRPRRG